MAIFKRLHRSIAWMAVLLAASLSAITLAQSASAATPSKPTPNPYTTTWQDAAGNTFTVRALSAAEIKAKGLDKYVDMSKLRAVAPHNASPTPRIQLVKPVKAVKRSAGSVAPMDSGCWSGSFGSGKFNNPQLWGKTDVNWCGDGTWVTYANSGCYGYDNWATYNYENCTNYTNYGVGWNLYQVKSQWSLCYAYVPLWGACASRDKPWQQWQFLGDGEALWTGTS